MNKNFSIIVAIDSRNGIGKNGDLPWHISKDLKYFKDITCHRYGGADKNTFKNILIMGRNTWDSIPNKFRPLPGRINVVLSSRDLALPEGVLLKRSLDEALQINNKGEIFVIGGGALYKEAIKHPNLNKLYITHVQGDFGCDTFFPKINPSKFAATSSSEEFLENGINFKFSLYDRA